MTQFLYPIQTLDQNNKPLGGVFIDAKSPNGNWQAVTDDCGWFNAFLTDGHYDVVFSKAGYKDEPQSWNLHDAPHEPIEVGLQVSNDFPNYPTREQVCDIFCGFQGISILTKQFGWIQAFGPEVGALSDEDTISYCQQMRELGFTHVEIAISWQYDELDFDYPVPGLDLAYNLPELARRCDLIIRQGMFIKFSMSGDGISVNDDPQQGEYNDPQGWTYGYQWAMINVERVYDFLVDYQGHDLTRFIAFVPGYDGVFYGWGIEGEVPDLQPHRVIEFGNHFRNLYPAGNLLIEHSTGKIPVGESGHDWTNGGPLDAYDGLLSEYDPFNLHSDNTWQIVGRCTRPYNRPPDQPAGDDPNPPYIIEDCSRGKRFYIMYELLTYLWVRHEVTVQDCNNAYDYFRAMAPSATLCMVRQ
jgi:hypothetical protein